MRKKPLVSVIIPCYNEEKNLSKLLKDIHNVSKNIPLEIIVVDDGSTDATASVISLAKQDLASRDNFKYFKHKKNQGKGASVRTGAKHTKGDFIVQIDADNQFLPSEMFKIIKPLTAGYDVALGTRYEKGSKIERGSVEIGKFFGSVFLSLLTSIFSGKRITDVMAGLKGFKRSVLLELNHKTNHFGYEAELVIKAAQKGYKIVNVPISYKKRVIGSSNVSIKHFFLVLSTILKTGLGIL